MYIDEHLGRTACCVWEEISLACVTTLPYAVDNATYVLAMQLPEFWLLYSLQVAIMKRRPVNSFGPPKANALRTVTQSDLDFGMALHTH